MPKSGKAATSGEAAALNLEPLRMGDPHRFFDFGGGGLRLSSTKFSMQVNA